MFIRSIPSFTTSLNRIDKINFSSKVDTFQSSDSNWFWSINTISQVVCVMRERERERFWFVSKLMDMAMDFWETCVIQWLFFDSQFKTWCSQHVTSHHTVVRLICSFTLQWNNWKQGDTIFWQIEWNCNSDFVFVFVWMFFMFVHFHLVTFELFLWIKLYLALNWGSV